MVAMRTLVVYAHPLHDSFAHALMTQVVETLSGRGFEVRVTDLYREDFQPCLTAQERAAYNTPSPLMPPEIEPHVDDLRWAEALVFCFPHWWYGMPAILKGYLDRVWMPSVAFHLSPESGMIRPGLTNIRKFAVVTTYGAPWWFMRLFMLEPTRTILLRGMGRLCGSGLRTLYLAHYSMDSSTPRSRQRFLRRVARRFGTF